MRMLIGRNNPYFIIHDVQAWVSMIAIVGMSVSAIIHLIINPSLSDPLNLPKWDGFMAVGLIWLSAMTLKDWISFAV